MATVFLHKFSRRIALVLTFAILLSFFAFQTVAFADDKVDITEEFTDEVFRNFVYSKIQKEPGEPIYDTDVANIHEFKIRNSNDKPPVESLDGIEYFTSLDELYLSYLQITELDLTMMKNLRDITVRSCSELKSIDVRGLEKLELLLSDCNFGLMDLKLSSSSNLIGVLCTNSQLSELDLSGCSALEVLHIEDNNLRTLDITPCPKLHTLTCTGNLFEDTSAIIGYEGRDLWDGSIELDFYPQKSESSDELPLQDVAETDWFYDGVRYAFESGLMKGVSDDRFAPQEEVSRAMIATVLHRLAGTQKAEGSNPFPDVEAGQWYSDAVIWAADEKIIEGYSSGSFGTNDPVTREQLVTMLWRYQGKPAGEAGALKAFADAAGISAWAEDAFAWAVDAGVIQGKTGGILDPQGTITRAEVAQILMNYDLINS